MSDDVLIKVENVSKKFCRRLRKSLWYGVQDMAAEAMGGSRSHDELRPDEFWAVKDVSFEVRRGECLGLIGHNGAGKTTLLKMLNGLIKPDHGSITMRGRVGALIALGAGFNPILTGRENIYVSAAVLGIPKDTIDQKLSEIIEFSDLDQFIDTPVQNYSSGMHVRLGFSIAAALRPDILIIDEILAVGDVRFRTKCYQHIERIQKSTALLIVSHNKQDIARHCMSSLVLHKGEARYLGDTKVALNISDQLQQVRQTFLTSTPGLTLVRAEFEHSTIKWDETAVLRLAIKSDGPISGASLRVTFIDTAFAGVAEWRTENHAIAIEIGTGNNFFELPIRQLRLQSGTYLCNIVLWKVGLSNFLLVAHHHMDLTVTGTEVTYCPYHI